MNLEIPGITAAEVKSSRPVNYTKHLILLFLLLNSKLKLLGGASVVYESNRAEFYPNQSSKPAELAIGIFNWALDWR